MTYSLSGLLQDEPVEINGNTSETSRPRLLWAQAREMKLIARKQEAEKAAYSTEAVASQSQG